jgi:hypothetical protein
MTGHRPFSTLRDGMTPERRAQTVSATQDALHELRQSQDETPKPDVRQLPAQLQRSDRRDA